MPMTTYTGDALKAVAATAYTASAALPANTDQGSTVGAILDAIKLLALNVQAQGSYLQAISRLGTTPANADGTPSPEAISFCAPFGVNPLPATASTGSVTLSTPSPVAGSPLVVPQVGVLSTTSGLLFSIYADSTNPAYNLAANGYLIPVGQSSVTVPVRCQSLGTLGNVAAGQITQVYGGGIVGISKALNAAAFTNAVNAETQAAFVQRFTLTVSGSRSGSNAAIAAAILGVQPGLTYAIGDRLDQRGNVIPSYFTVVVNQVGGGTPPGSLIIAVSQAIALVKAVGIGYNVIPPAMLTASATALVYVPVGTDTVALSTALTTAYTNAVNAVGLNPAGGSTRLSFMAVGGALQAVPGVSFVGNVTVNGGAADLVVPFGQQVVAGTLTLTFQVG